MAFGVINCIAIYLTVWEHNYNDQTINHYFGCLNDQSDQQLWVGSVVFQLSIIGIQRKQIHSISDLVKTYRHKATFWKIFAGTEDNPLSLKTKAII